MTIETELNPLTIVKDKFNGIYSMGKFTAWLCDHCDIPNEIYMSEGDSACFWGDRFAPFRNEYEEYLIPSFGVGNTIEEAIANLKFNLKGTF